jgi:hypothetical protein
MTRASLNRWQGAWRCDCGARGKNNELRIVRAPERGAEMSCCPDCGRRVASVARPGGVSRLGEDVQRRVSQLRAEGWSLRAIGRDVGVCHQTVANILKAKGGE